MLFFDFEIDGFDPSVTVSVWLYFLRPPQFWDSSSVKVLSMTKAENSSFFN